MKTIPGLQDIQGLDDISFWPLAIGWWILMGLLVTVGLTFFAIYFWKMKKRSRWQFSALSRLNEMEKQLTSKNSQNVALQFSEFIRRLAVHRFSRQECAGLKGITWLKWLSQKDPKKFDWVKHSRCIIQAPFSPLGTAFDTQSLRLTINAAKEWVK